MAESVVPRDAVLPDRTRPTYLERLGRRLLLSRLGRLRHGRLTLSDGAQRHEFGDLSDYPVEATVTVHHPSFYADIVFGGTVGAGEAYMAGSWTTDDLTAAIRIIIRNEDVLEAMDSPLTRGVTAVSHKLFHLFRKNTKRGSRLNIAAHYDLGNDFYALFLDDTLTYSCGIFEGDDSTLREASVAKYDRLCRKLRLCPDDHVVEIGTGWGGFAIHAASNYGCRVTTTTISHGPPICGCGIWKTLRRITPARCGSGGSASSRGWTTFAPRASTTRSCGCGNSTSATAKRALPSGTSATCRWS